jgi:NAD(P)-dependent dehydrogenase (short-subunit alcohol dehydrogenase family)
MSRNILITGGSGYIGGSLLAELKKTTDLPSHGTIYALVRNEQQAEKVKSHYNATPLTLDLEDQSAITATLLEKQISVVFFLINAFNADSQVKFIEALAAVKGRHGVQTHFLHTTGAKLFSSFTGHPTDRVLSDAEEGLYEIQKAARSKFPPMETVCDVNADMLYPLQLLTNLSFCRPLAPTTESSKLVKSTASAHTSTSHVSPMARAPASVTVFPSRPLLLCVLPKPCVGSARLTMKMA